MAKDFLLSINLHFRFFKSSGGGAYHYPTRLSTDGANDAEALAVEGGMLRTTETFVAALVAVVNRNNLRRAFHSKLNHIVCVRHSNAFCINNIHRNKT